MPSRSPRSGWLVAPLAAVATLCLAVAVLLALTPLYEMPDTYCQTVVHPSVGGGPCADVRARRVQWIVWVIAAGVVLAIAAVVVRRRSAHRQVSRSRWAAWVLLAVAVVFALVSAGFLVVGSESDQCGSRLSRIDERGSYAPDRARACVATWESDRSDAWLFALLALGCFTTGSVVEVAGRSGGRPAISGGT